MYHFSIARSAPISLENVINIELKAHSKLGSSFNLGGLKRFSR